MLDEFLYFYRVLEKNKRRKLSHRYDFWVSPPIVQEISISYVGKVMLGFVLKKV